MNEKRTQAGGEARFGIRAVGAAQLQWKTGFLFPISRGPVLLQNVIKIEL